MKKYLLVSLLASLVFINKAQEDNFSIVKVGDTIPSFTAVSDNGSRLQSASLKGKVILVNFFVTRCPSCQKELAVAQRTLRPKCRDNKDSALLVIGREHSDTDLQEYNGRKNFDFSLYPGKDWAIFDAFTKNLIPRGYLVGKDGKIIYASRGCTDEELAELMTKVEDALR